MTVQWPGHRTVTCNTCERGDGWGRHCIAACHSDRHRACAHCGSCLPDRHRRDRRIFCGASCRAAGYKARQGARLEREVWEIEHPDEARQQAEQLAQWAQQVHVLDGFLDLAKSPDAQPVREARESATRARSAAIRSSPARCFGAPPSPRTSTCSRSRRADRSSRARTACRCTRIPALHHHCEHCFSRRVWDQDLGFYADDWYCRDAGSTITAPTATIATHRAGQPGHPLCGCGRPVATRRGTDGSAGTSTRRTDAASCAPSARNAADVER